MLLQDSKRMKKLFYLSMAALLVLGAVSCDKDSKKTSYGVDGVTPMPEAVDLGIEVDGHKVLFGSFNLGASREDEIGDYYAWGETETHYTQLDPITWKEGMEVGYDWPVYKYGILNYKLKRYCTHDAYWDGEGDHADGLTQLLPEDDVAHVKLGGKWRMPTADEIKALIALYGKDGYEFDASEKGLRVTQTSTGNSVFFPNGGVWYDNRLLPVGDIWTSTVMDTSPSNAQLLSFWGGGEFSLFCGSRARAHGLPVRPVYVEEGPVTMKAVDIGTVVNGHKVLWGECNIGARKEYELGDHFAWGEITPKTNYTWATYSHANGAYNKLIKYCPWSEEDGYWDLAAKPSGADEYMQLKPEDDVASVQLGGKWRMPTKEDFYALLDLQESRDYNWEPWFEMKDANGKAVHGLKVTQKSTNNYVFFPAAGQYYEDRLYSGEDPDVESGYWSSSLYDGPCAIFMYFEPYDPQNTEGRIGRDDVERYIGFSVRPVWEE